jgi:hypothetical protein
MEKWSSTLLGDSVGDSLYFNLNGRSLACKFPVENPYFSSGEYGFPQRHVTINNSAAMAETVAPSMRMARDILSFMQSLYLSSLLQYSAVTVVKLRRGLRPVHTLVLLSVIPLHGSWTGPSYTSLSKKGTKFKVVETRCRLRARIKLLTLSGKFLPVEKVYNLQ